MARRGRQPKAPPPFSKAYMDNLLLVGKKEWALRVWTTGCWNVHNQGALVQNYESAAKGTSEEEITDTDEETLV